MAAVTSGAAAFAAAAAATARVTNVNRRAPSGPLRAPPGVSGGDRLPNCTLYCRNLNDQINVLDLKACLFEFMSPFGEIIEIIANKTQAGRGQAFVVFRDITASSAALRALNGREFLDKTLMIQFAKSKSDATLRMEGNFKPRKPGTSRTRTDRTADDAPVDKVTEQRPATC
eukprot:GHVT01045240.1.p1 GENE.GHVT01045240.1~~GHVT01045240.1.p1  ORF type:complete len:172 (-),score=36.50 GHVT01045240.1:1492-2007(-)